MPLTFQVVMRTMVACISMEGDNECKRRPSSLHNLNSHGIPSGHASHRTRLRATDTTSHYPATELAHANTAIGKLRISPSAKPLFRQFELPPSHLTPTPIAPHLHSTTPDNRRHVRRSILRPCRASSGSRPRPCPRRPPQLQLREPQAVCRSRGQRVQPRACPHCSARCRVWRVLAQVVALVSTRLLEAGVDSEEGGTWERRRIVDEGRHAGRPRHWNYPLKREIDGAREHANSTIALPSPASSSPVSTPRSGGMLTGST